MISKFNKYSTIQTWLISLLVFQGGTLVIIVFDYFGEKWLKITWPHDPDLFPNMILAYPLFLIQLLAVGLLITTGAKIYKAYKGIRGILLSLTLVLSTGVVCFFTYAFVAYWYQYELMGRSI